MSPQSPILIKRTFPWTDTVQGQAVAFRLMTREDQLAIVSLARSLDDVDLAFLRQDITQPAVVDEWIEQIERGRTITILVEIQGRVAGYGSLFHDEMLWTSHIGEIRLLVSGKYRGLGLAKRLAAELFHIAREMRLERVVCQIPAAQARVRHMLERLGFSPDAILGDWIMSRDGQMHDLIIMSRPPDELIIA